MVNPYAPPGAAPLVLPRTPLLPGITRHRLVPELYRPMVRRVLVRRGVLTAALYAAIVAMLGAMGLPISLTTWALIAVLWAGSTGLAWMRARAELERQLAMFEVLASPRVVRRIMPLLPVAEMLRPEVTRIVETARGLWLVAQNPRRTLFLVSALENFSELRAAVGTWGRVESLRGLPAFFFAYGQLRHMRPRDTLEGALAADPTLTNELQTVRMLSADQGAGYPGTIVPRRRLVRMLVLWVLLVVFFLAIWQFLSPSPRPRARPTHTTVTP